MLQSLRQIKSRIRSTENTKKITRAMEMISISKLRRSEHMFSSSREYFRRVDSLLTDVIAGYEKVPHPLFQARADKTKIALFLVTSDTGLCSVYNNSIIYAAEKFLSRYDPLKVKLVVLGRKGFTYFLRKGFIIPRSYVGLNGHYSEGLADDILKVLSGLFLSGDVSEVHAVYMQVRAASRYKPVIEKFLNIERPKQKVIEYIAEPALDKILETLIPVYLSGKMKSILLNAFTAEHQARAMAMGEATQNATELLEDLILLRNKVRQANITREIIEVISSAEALKG